MIKLYNEGVYLINGHEIIHNNQDARERLIQSTGIYDSPEIGAKGTMSYQILEAHNTSDTMDHLKLKFDAIASHDLTYVGIIQTARASGLKEFPIPYVLTNCHNSLCAVGGTINEDDHQFAISAAHKFGGIYVPAHLAVIHQYLREMVAKCGSMILGSDSHTRYGALGTLAIGEGGGELAKQLLKKTYDIKYPEVIAVYLSGKPALGVGPQDVALSIIKAVFPNQFVTNKIMEFVGDGIENLDVEYRHGIDVMTTETTCLSSVWKTDKKVEHYLNLHNRADDFRKIKPKKVAYYDGMIYVDLSKIRPMIAMPFHPSNALQIDELLANPKEILSEVESKAIDIFDNKNLKLNLLSKVSNGQIYVDQGVVAGCAGGTYDNIVEMGRIMNGKSIGNGFFTLSVYPSSQPVNLSLMKQGITEVLINAGAIMKTAFCGPCFGAGDIPANNGLSIRHTTRNFPNREGSVPKDGQIASVALMDARSIAATAINGGRLTAATEIEFSGEKPEYQFEPDVYQKRVYQGYGHQKTEQELIFGPNIADWPHMSKLADHLVLKVASFLTDPVTTTDELIPSGETSSYRSNPIRLAEFTLFRKDPNYVGKAKSLHKGERSRTRGDDFFNDVPELETVFRKIKSIPGFEELDPQIVGIGSTLYAVKPGDGSAREQAASCQRVLGGWANIANEYATKRYRSNLINWGMMPFRLVDEPAFKLDDYIFIPNVKKLIEAKEAKFDGYIVSSVIEPIELFLDEMSDEERSIILAGSLINYYGN